MGWGSFDEFLVLISRTLDAGFAVPVLGFHRWSSHDYPLFAIADILPTVSFVSHQLSIQLSIRLWSPP